MTEIDAFVTRLVTTYSEQLNERVAFMPSCEDISRRLLPGRSSFPLARYDVTDVQPERMQEIIEADWHHLLQEKRALNSPNYLREDGKPVIAIWGTQRSQPILSAHLLNYALSPRPRLRWPQ